MSFSITSSDSYFAQLRPPDAACESRDENFQSASLKLDNFIRIKNGEFTLEEWGSVDLM